MNLYKNNLERIVAQTSLEPADIEAALRGIAFANYYCIVGGSWNIVIAAQNAAGEMRSLLRALGADFAYIDRAVENLPPTKETR